MEESQNGNVGLFLNGLGEGRSFMKWIVDYLPQISKVEWSEFTGVCILPTRYLQWCPGTVPREGAYLGHIPRAWPEFRRVTSPESLLSHEAFRG
jgi:hypothetical protein